MVVDQTNGTLLTDYSNRNAVVEKGTNSIMVVMALDDSNIIYLGGGGSI